MLGLENTPEILSGSPAPELWLVLVTIAILVTLVVLAAVVASRLVLPLSALLQRRRRGRGPRHRSSRKPELSRGRH
ncbi:hypothetical protein [Paenarthrobacter sp. 2TAF44]|uniref:hypothetical protein n=1 Tax=Paenarthrobacter sp. 2TAF44 TaxID=3233018 RepID=UPI003F9C0716